jgi:hypothetical protein
MDNPWRRIGGPPIFWFSVSGIAARSSMPNGDGLVQPEADDVADQPFDFLRERGNPSSPFVP